MDKHFGKTCAMSGTIATSFLSPKMWILICRKFLPKAVLLILCAFFLSLLFSEEKTEYDENMDFREPGVPNVNWFTASDRSIDWMAMNYSRDSTTPCDDIHPPFLLILVHSSPSHFIHRSTIRKTWGSQPLVLGHSVRIVFIVGEAGTRIRKRLSYEMLEHRDLVRGNFIDSYRNLTFKHLLSYHWFHHNCKRSAVAMKTDDDVFIDVYRAVSLLRNTFGTLPQNILAGMLIPSGSFPQRKGKWAVTRQEYPHEVYPEYLSGMVYFFTADVAQKILYVSKSLPFFWIDDVFVTGFSADAAGVRKSDLGVWFARNEGLLFKWLENDSLRPCPWLAAELTPRRWPYDVHRLWVKASKAWNAGRPNTSAPKT